MYTDVNPEGLQLPSVTLCPGFKKGVFDSVYGHSYPHILRTKGRSKTLPTTEEEVLDWYKARTYDLDEGTYFTLLADEKVKFFMISIAIL